MFNLDLVKKILIYAAFAALIYFIIFKYIIMGLIGGLFR